MAATRIPTRAEIRARFPALGNDFTFLENAGGSQVPAGVAERMHEYMTTNYVQLGAGYPMSDRADAVVEEAHSFANQLVNGSGGTSILGSSSSVLLRILADAYGEVWKQGGEIVLAQCGHESNLSPWLRLERFGARIRWWNVDPATGESSLEALESLVGPNTVLVAFPHVSNLLGDIADVAAATRITHAAGARVVVDGVAYAPHRAVDVAAWGVDWYAVSLYKVYGPHLGALWGRADAISEVPGPNFFFIPERDIPYKFELGGVSHEACAGLLGTREYFAFLGGMDGEACDRRAIERAGALMTELELPLQKRLLDWLAARDGVRVVGPTRTDASRVGTVSFVSDDKASEEIVKGLHAAGIGCRNGHMYARRLCEALGIDAADGVVRISLVHYNTEDEIEHVLETLDAIL